MRKKVLVIVTCIALTLSLVVMTAACTKADTGSSDQKDASSSSESAVGSSESAVGDSADTNSTKSTDSDSASAAGGKKTIGVYADANGSFYDLEVETIKKLAAQDPECDWEIVYKIGQGSAEDQLKAVEDFISSKYDAMAIIQNNENTTDECIAKAVAANVPYFGATHYFGNVPNAGQATAAEGFNFEECGKFAGENALKNNAKKIVMIEGVLGQGTASAQSAGFLKAYEDAGKSLGTKSDGTPYTAEEIANDKPSKVGGNPDVEVVFWGAGEWMPEPAQKKMQDAITALGPDGWDGVYVHNDPMAEGVIAAIENAGLKPADKWIGACNGREISWQWVKDGVIDMDVNESPCIDGMVVFQQMKAYFAGKDFPKYIYCYATPYDKDNIDAIESSLVPASDVDNFIKKYNDGSIINDINDPAFKKMPGFGQ